MAAPVSIAHTHVHSLRISSGAEALAARVLTAEGAVGFGFTLNVDAGVARDMAAWDALARSRNVPLYALLGGSKRKSVQVVRDQDPALPVDWDGLRKGLREDRWKLLRIDPFAWGSLEMVQTIAAGAPDLGIALLAPNAHAWEVAWCAMLAATLGASNVRVIVRVEPKAKSVDIPDQPGIGVDWSLEPAFSSIRW